MSENATLKYVHQDHLGGTSVVTSDNGTLLESLKYYSFGETRSISGLETTDKLFTGQRLDGTGLYYYNARYYDPTIGRFISPDTIIPSPSNPQSFNRYTYCLNNPLKYIDPSGHDIMNNGYCIDGVNVNNIEDYVFSNQNQGIYFDVEILVAVAILREVAPELVETLEYAKQDISLYYDDSLPEIVGGQLVPAEGFVEKGNLGIKINPKLIEDGAKMIAYALGHEGFHTVVALEAQNNGLRMFPGNSIANEYFAYSFGNDIAHGL